MFDTKADYTYPEPFHSQPTSWNGKPVAKKTSIFVDELNSFIKVKLNLYQSRMMRQLWHLSMKRFLSTAPNVDKNLLSKLRKQTGIPFINCKKALSKFDNDFDQAKKWLLAEAQKEGWTRATKLQARPMSQGLVAVLADKKHATMIEVNCETDFVAKNEKFVAMVSKLVEECSGYLQGIKESELCLNKAELDQIKTSEHGTLADIVSLNIGNLGENMSLRRGVFLQAGENNILSSYVHPSGGDAAGKRLLLGKYGAVLELVPPPADFSEESLSELGRELCQHIVGMNPQTVGEYSPSLQIRQSALSSEGGVEDENSDQGYRSDTSSEDSEQMQTELLKQDFLLDSSICVGEFLESQGAPSVARFKRFACGEELDGDIEEQ
ncbi:hypothetical protein RRG08_040587 [Elysia crispata]|uniref:Elongation factor Ts, mitochondrial n=1 Tax=Elysia crispata TaxID=231223 RepID=A0AAE0YK22_9GAST|nr:hypothetical protein RRG08_040587 [Elysia crispata]